jgi:hypothetical protein
LKLFSLDRKRSLATDDDSGNGSKRQRLAGIEEEDFDEVIADIVKVIDDESKMLGKLNLIKSQNLLYKYSNS